MKITILTENMTRIDAYYLGEPGVSYLIECDNKKYLFDTGYSDVFVRNAKKMGVCLNEIDAIILSHGHNDHTGGMKELPEELEGTTVYAHPEFSSQRVYEGVDVGSPLKDDFLRKHFHMKLFKEPVSVSEHLVFLGQIPRINHFESLEPIGKRKIRTGWEPDFLPDDTALVYKGKEGLTIITGCSHSGICNITEYAKSVCGDTRVYGIIGGFHLMDMSARVEKTVDYLKKQSPKLLCPSHCTCFQAREAIDKAIHITEVCVGDIFEVE